MKVLKYLAALWAAVVVYTVLSLFYGAMGFSAYERLLSGRDLQWANLKKLGAVNAELENTQNNLLYDQDTIAMYARSLGYGQDNERFRIVGLGGIKNPYTAAGEVVSAPLFLIKLLNLAPCSRDWPYLFCCFSLICPGVNGRP